MPASLANTIYDLLSRIYTWGFGQMLTTLLVFIHLLATCIAVGVLLIQDFSLARAQGKPLAKPEIVELKLSATRVSFALVALWVSGIALVTNGYLGHPDYVLNEKIWAKITVVFVLSLNGLLLHYYAFPLITTGKGLNGLKLSQKTLIALSGSVSSTSWLFACYLGIARPWNFSITYGSMMLIYFSLIVITFVVACQCIKSFSKGDELIAEKKIA
jgi:hypothetical protein